ncbi:hypothetical protein WICANDRAFT_62635 [Wickerhamomyces anomalus NRRL Y-366-8]|uniref:Uncharacterized protein n=1 Tax=Wickerhamomyces anomalus (strain ATCC 58044 / CBS 1984 / NCYC 433 / NRRL Y-366-8) TaxID=683960 RepID=A0A1E3P3K0_WICAA|nr:uncharacterized protein WICANDRAFT_62635 [Wickerhamomyces anomalus NRRL Y-366-8]ODQ60066.1 hypothetical protein WICANDRAFT_62635 [Wickerhamomyces anomalus NRRL Y-366-8]
MCRPAQCSICNKASWFGCGLHIPSAMSNSPKEEWCTCVNSDGERGEYPPKAGTGKAA